MYSDRYVNYFRILGFLKSNGARLTASKNAGPVGSPYVISQCVANAALVSCRVVSCSHLSLGLPFFFFAEITSNHLFPWIRGSDGYFVTVKLIDRPYFSIKR